MHFSEKIEEFREAKPLGNSICDVVVRPVSGGILVLLEF